MFYRYGGAFLATMTDTNEWVRMYQSPKLEFVVNQDCWWSTETRLADVILPACTNLERDDISEWASSGGYSAHASGQRQPPDHHLPAEVRRAGGRVQGRLRHLRASWQSGWASWRSSPRATPSRDGSRRCSTSRTSRSTSPTRTSRRRATSSSRRSRTTSRLPRCAGSTRAGRATRPTRATPERAPTGPTSWRRHSGKIEFVAQTLLARTPDDDERPPLPHYIPSWEGHESELASDVPARSSSRRTLASPSTPSTTHHVPWLSEIPGHRSYKDGYDYQVVRMHPDDARARGIRHGDVVEAVQRPRLRAPDRPGDRARETRASSTRTRARPGTIRWNPARPAAPTGAVASTCSPRRG